ncbi:MAG: hypothetical protein KatS3mg084_0212 [Candidatus Dojkabacteria bacterium]|nr:MAG: hypothetical protein KatS3mg084_0212 [Candidatus Dojkabacteria bacterium]
MLNPEGQHQWSARKEEGNLSREDGELGRGIQQSGPEQNQNSQPHGGFQRWAENIMNGLQGVWGELFGQQPRRLIEFSLPPEYKELLSLLSLSRQDYANLALWAQERRKTEQNPVSLLKCFVMENILNQPPFPRGMVVVYPASQLPGTTHTGAEIGPWFVLGTGKVTGRGGIFPGIFPGFGQVKIENSGKIKIIERFLGIFSTGILNESLQIVVTRPEPYSWELVRLNREILHLYGQIGNKVTLLGGIRITGEVVGFAYNDSTRIIAAIVALVGEGRRPEEQRSMVLVPVKRLG